MAIQLELDAPSDADTMPDNERLEWAIKARADVEKVKIPYGVTEISAYAFSNCIKLRQVVIPSTLGIVREYAFSK